MTAYRSGKMIKMILIVAQSAAIKIVGLIEFLMISSTAVVRNKLIGSHYTG